MNLTTILTWASDPTWPSQAKYAQFVDDAVTAATKTGSPPVAAYPDVTAWRTRGSGSPGANFQEIGTWSGNTFYSTRSR